VLDDHQYEHANVADIGDRDPVRITVLRPLANDSA